MVKKMKTQYKILIQLQPIFTISSNVLHFELEPGTIYSPSKVQKGLVNFSLTSNLHLLAISYSKSCNIYTRQITFSHSKNTVSYFQNTLSHFQNTISFHRNILSYSPTRSKFLHVFFPNNPCYYRSPRLQH